MAARKNYLGKPNYRFLTGDRDNNLNSETMFEFDEANLWNSNHHHHHVSSSPDQFKKSIPSSRISKIKSNKRVENGDRVDGTAKSLPVNIPDWSKILREDRRDVNRRIGNGNYIDDDDEDEDDENGRIPPHEFLARQLGRTQISSFSVHEGIGRTLKGRDLSRVRDAIWEKTGFED
ncbi:Senescence regulator S40 [Macleaya cordata]|uniref:Senescence regulator S40 n=1 Tax=Macleaya cordata TaxID=56857 RepID=A0A200R5W7_MACCD|nr:Senescence regulator S40 [Macleaya cordata]